MRTDSKSANLCVLCRAVNALPVEGRPVFDTHLLSTSGFVVVPAVGPISVGHVMIVSRDHIPNLASLGDHDREEYRELLRRVATLPVYERSTLLEAEHGSSTLQSGGACINHMHVNLIPDFARFTNIFDGKLPQREIDFELALLSPSAAPYIFMRGGSEVRLYEAGGVPSQLIRRALFEELGRSDWDWAIFPHLDIVQRTIHLWKSGNA